MKPVVSIITPCYNSGKYLQEAVDSVRKNCSVPFEIIITNDGSTDLFTLDLLTQLENSGIKVLHQKNQGPAMARNKAVEYAEAEYLLFLDSDNRLRPTYVEKSIEILRNELQVGVVHGQPFFFGSEGSPRFEAGEFDLDRMLEGNYIDMCAVVRKKAWVEVGGFDENMFGCEDGELWVRLGLANWKFKFLNELMFDYRVRDNSVTAVVDSKINQIVVSSKHSQVIHQRYKYYFRMYNKFNDQPFLYFAKALYSKYVLGKKYLPK